MKLDGTIVFLLALAVYVLTAVPSVANEHLIAAHALLRGNPYVDPMVLHEQVTVAGHSYILHPPLATVAMLPAAILHVGNQTLMLVILAAFAVALVYRITDDVWLAAFFGFGTPFWYEATLGNSWGFCLVLSTLPTLLALSIRGYLSGFWAGLAALARYDLALVWPVYLWRKGWRVLPGLALAAALYIGWSYVRFGTLTDHTLWLWWATDPYRAPHIGANAGPFSLVYLPWNLYTALFMAPHFQPAFPWVRPWVMGEALVFTSPALLLTMLGRLTIERAALWLAVALSMGACLTVYANGFVQFGSRYWIQALPFLVLLMPKGQGRALIILSIILTGGQMWVVRHYGLVGPVAQ